MSDAASGLGGLDGCHGVEHLSQSTNVNPNLDSIVVHWVVWIVVQSQTGKSSFSTHIVIQQTNGKGGLVIWRAFSNDNGILRQCRRSL